MKVKIGPYIDWIGPYQIAEKLMWWIPKYTEDYKDNPAHDKVHQFGTWLAEDKNGNDSYLAKFCEWLHSTRKRTIKVKLDKWDSWNADGTLAIVILPVLKQLRDTKHGSPMVDPEDVPYELRITGTEDYSGQIGLDLFDDEENKEIENASWKITQLRWDWVLNEIIWAFEQMQPDCDWEDQYHHGEIDIKWEVSKEDTEGKPLLYTMGKGPKDTHTFDMEGHRKHSARIDNGLRLFGKYYRGLWN